MGQSPSFIPRVLHIDITGRCNLSCLHCRGFIRGKELSFTEWDKIIGDISRHWAKNIEWVEIGGGEPFMRKDIFDLIRLIRKKMPGAKILLVTNGLLIRKEQFKEIFALIDRIQFSLDGSRKETHDKIRQFSGAFNKTIEIIRSLKNENQNLYTIIRATIMKINYTELEEIIKLGKKLKVNEVGIRAMVVSEGSSVLNKELEISSEEYHKLLREIPRLQSKYKIRIYSGDPLQNLLDPIFIKHIRGGGYKLEDTFAGCLVGISYLYINNAGALSFCPMLNTFLLGDLLKEDIAEIWENNPLLNKLRKSEFSETSACSKCKFNCLCGGCRARAFFTKKDIFEQDPICNSSLRAELNNLWEKNG